MLGWDRLNGRRAFEGYAMTKRALVTGSVERAQAVADLFRQAGVASTAVSELDELVDVPGPCDYYVQLPVTVSTKGDSVVQRLHSFLIDGLLSRFAAVERVLPMLAPGATVVLVAGNSPAELSAPDDRLARLALLRVLAHATRADLAPDRARVRIVSAARTDREVVDYALSGSKDPDAELSHPADTPESGRAYEDWRSGVMGLVGIQS
jgi:hypothetical protein